MCKCQDTCPACRLAETINLDQISNDPVSTIDKCTWNMVKSIMTSTLGNITTKLGVDMSMKKEDILARSRQSHKDEGMEHAENRGRKIGFIAYTIVTAILAVLSLFFWQLGTLHAVSLLFWTYFCFESYSKFRFTKKKRYLVMIIGGGVAAIYALISYILVLVG